MRAMRDTGHIDLAEPFAGLFTQGMVNHATFRDELGEWLEPQNVEQNENGLAVRRDNGAPVTVGRIEKMSKSKKNTIDPTDVIRDYGADTARWFILSDSPPDRDMEWTDSGVQGAFRFVNRVARLVMENAGNLPPVGSGEFGDDADATKLRRDVHSAIDDVTADLERFQYNRAVARIYELTNVVSGAVQSGDTNRASLREALETLIRLIAPMMPHLAEEMWVTLGHTDHLSDVGWPIADQALLVAESVTYAIQVNGKLRGTVDLPVGADQDTTEEAARAVPNVVDSIGDKEIRKLIFVPDKLVNFVV
jgi:leucyl-tRNA synthetase